MLRRLRTGIRAAFALPLLLCAAARAEDWPQFRGPNRDGAWRETGTLESFPTGGLTIRWRAPAGSGFSSPVIAEGRVFLIDSELTKPQAKERVRCFEETTGKVLWTFSYDVKYPEWAFGPANKGGPNATPVAHLGRLYTLGQLGHLFCFDAPSGAVLWKKDLEKVYQVKEFSGTPSPLIEGDLLILTFAGRPDAGVAAFRKDSGEEAWKSLHEGQTNSSPIVIDAGGRRQLIVWTQGSVISLDPATGKPHWREPLNLSADAAVSTPVFRKDLLLVGGLMLKLDSGKPAASVLWPETQALARKVLSNTSTALFLDDHLFSARSSGTLVCLEAGTGKQVWETDRVTDPKGGASIHLTPNGGSVLLYTDRGELIRARLTSKEYIEVSRARLLEPTYPYGGRKVAWPPPAYANLHVFARNDEEMVCASLAARP